MAATVFACTFVEKTVMTDDFKHGADPKSCRTIMLERVGCVAASFAALVQKLSEKYFLDMTEIYIITDEEGVTGFSFSRQEGGTGDTLSEAEYKAWQEGGFASYLADYFFRVEKREVSALTREDLQGVSWHE